MKYAKVQKSTPAFVNISEINTAMDTLFRDIYENEVLLAAAGTKITTDMLKKLRSHGINRVWIARGYYDWIPIKEALKKNIPAVETKVVNAIQSKLIENLDLVSSLNQLEVLLNKYSRMELEPERENEIEFCLDEVKTLQNEEPKLQEKILNLKGHKQRDKVLEIFMDIIRSDTIDFETSRVPQKYQDLVNDFSDFIDRIEKVRARLNKILLEIDDEKQLDEAKEEIDSIEKEPEERVNLIKEVQNQAVQAAAEAGKTIVDQNSVVDQLFSRVTERSGLSAISEFYKTVYNIFRSVTHSKMYLPRMVKELKQKSIQLVHRLPDPYWALAETSMDEQNLLVQALNRCIIYAQVWPQEITDQEFDSRIIALLFQDLGLAEVPELLGKSEKIIRDDKADSEESINYSHYSVEMLEEVEGIPKKALKLIEMHNQQKSGSGWLVKESQRIALCGAFDALTTTWPWKEGIPPGKTANKLWQHFNTVESKIINHFCSQIGTYPSGTVVPLDDGDRAYVEKQTGQPDLPVVIKFKKNKWGDIQLGKRIKLQESKLSISRIPSDRIAPWKLRRGRLKFLNK